MRHALFPVLLGLVFVAGGRAGLARAQEQTPSETASPATSQTDASEDAWRKSKKKRTISDPFSRTPNRSSTGVGMNLPPLSAMERLPEESRRHLQRQRARVIASMKFGKDGKPLPDKNQQYQPSEAAKKDPALAKDEEEAWQVILTDLQGGGKGGAHAPGGPNKVTVAGRGGGQTGSVLRGGSAQSAAEIMARLKGLKAASGSPGASPPEQTPGKGKAAQKKAKAKEKDQNSQTGESQSAAKASSAQSTRTRENPPPAVRGGSAQGSKDILSDIKNSKGAQPGGQSASQKAQSRQQGQEGKQAGKGQSGQDGKGQKDGQKGDGAGGGQGANKVNTAKTAGQPPLDPLSLPAADTAAPDTACTRSSAYAYLHKTQKSENKPGQEPGHEPAGCE